MQKLWILVLMFASHLVKLSILNILFYFCQMRANFKSPFTLKKIFACDSLVDCVNEILKLKSQVIYLFVPFITTMNSMFNNIRCERHPTWCNVKPVGKYFSQISWSANMPFRMLNRRNTVRFFEMWHFHFIFIHHVLANLSKWIIVSVIPKKSMWSWLALNWFPLFITVLCFCK